MQTGGHPVGTELMLISMEPFDRRKKIEIKIAD
jgi:hypothetical protein